MRFLQLRQDRSTPRFVHHGVFLNLPHHTVKRLDMLDWFSRRYWSCHRATPY
jgi:hypothetical protein